MNLNTKCYKMNSKPLCAAKLGERQYILCNYSLLVQELDVMLQSQAIQAPILLN